jgi:hypothetical protein
MVLANPNYSCAKATRGQLPYVRPKWHMARVGQNRIYTPCMTIYMVNSLPKILYTHRIYMVLASPKYQGFVNHLLGVQSSPFR